MVEQDSDFGLQHRTLTIRFEGELGLSRIGELDRALTPASSLYGMELTVDVSAVTLMDPAVIDWLLCIRERLMHRNGSLRIVPSDPDFVTVLAPTGFQDRIDVDQPRSAHGARSRHHAGVVRERG